MENDQEHRETVSRPQMFLCLTQKQSSLPGYVVHLAPG